MTPKEFINNLVTGIVLVSLFAFSILVVVNHPKNLPDAKTVCEQKGGEYRATIMSKPLLKSCVTPNIR